MAFFNSRLGNLLAGFMAGLALGTLAWLVWLAVFAAEADGL